MKRKGASAINLQNSIRDIYKFSILIVSSHNIFSVFVCYHDIIILYIVCIEYLCNLSLMYGIEISGEIDDKDISCQIFCIFAFDNYSNRNYLSRGIPKVYLYRSISSKTIMFFFLIIIFTASFILFSSIILYIFVAVHVKVMPL